MAADVAALVRDVLAGIPAGCSWLTPVTGPGGRVTDFRVAATSGAARDVRGLGVRRVDALLSELYPTVVGGDLWELYLRVQATGEPEELADFRYEDRHAGVAAHSRFVISVHRVLGGLLVWWQRVDEHQRRLAQTEMLGSLGWSEYDLATGRVDWSAGMFPIFARDPAQGPLPRFDQAAMMDPDDRGIAETAWQTLDSGSPSDVTVRFHVGPAVKHLRILSDTARDAEGHPVKIYAVVQDVTGRETSRGEIDRLSDQLRTRNTTALAEHRLAGQVQRILQPVPAEPFALAGLEAIAGYVPAEQAVRVGGDWFHAAGLPTGEVALAVGDLAGHGLEAASGMAHLRFALIAWLSIGIREPGVLMAHLNGLCVQRGLTGTAAVAVYDPGTRELRWARAGHPPPLLGRAGAGEPLPNPRGLLLGAASTSVFPELRMELHPGDLVLLHTDGLTERRDETLIDDVLATLGAASAGPPAEALPAVRDLLRSASPDDDSCLLAIRVLP